MVPASSPKAVAMVVYTDRAAFKLVYNGTKYLVVYLIQSVLVDIQCLQRKLGNLRIDRAGAFHLCEVTYPAKQSIGNTGCPHDCGKQSPRLHVPSKAHPVWTQNDG